MPAMSRRLGISRNVKRPKLLQSLNCSETDVLPPSLNRNASIKGTPSANTKFSNQDEDSILAEPLSSDEEERNNEFISHSSDEEEAGRADIKPTNFKRNGDICTRATRDTRDDDGFGPIRDNVLAASSKSQLESPLRRSRRNGSEPGNGTAKKAKLETSTAYKTKELAIFNMTPSSSRRKSIKTYSSQSKSEGSRGSQSAGESSPATGFKKPPKVELDIATSPDKQFKIPGRVVSEEPEMGAGKSFKTFDLPDCNPDSSPNKKPQFRLGPDLSGLHASLDGNAPFRASVFMDLLQQNGSLTKDIIDQVPFRALENGEDAQSQPRIFQVPSMTPDITACSEPEASEVIGREDSSFQKTPPSPSPEPAPEASCPMCGESVDAMFLKDYNGGKRMNIRTQTKFCQAHKKKSARAEWTEKGYPTIDWNDFDTRLAQHHSYLKSLLDGASSYYRNMLAEQVRSGKDRTLLQAVSNSENSLTPGYYGLRGFRAMSENIIDKFSSQLRRIAITDRLVASRGVTSYVQNVLVPELAVKLICEDMNLGVEEARQVMRESAGVGDLLNEEVEDVVTWKEGDDTI